MSSMKFAPGEERPAAAARGQAAPLSPTGAQTDRLPRDLTNAKPRYGYGKKLFQPEFASDVDKALFITAQTNKSKRDADYRAWLNARGYSDADIARLGPQVRDAIKAQAKAAPEGGRLPIAQVTPPRGQQAPPAAAAGLAPVTPPAAAGAGGAGTPPVPPVTPGAPPPGAPPPGAGAPPPTGPALQGATSHDLQEGVLAAVRRMIFPSVSPSAKEAAGRIREKVGPMNRLKEIAFNRFTTDLHVIGNKMTEPDFARFADAYETGNLHTLSADEQRLARPLRQGYADFWNAIKTLPDQEHREAIKDYLTHMYKNDNGQVDNFTNTWFAGGGGSLQARKLPTYADAQAAGLTPLSANPIEHFTRYADAISPYIARRQMLAKAIDDGYAAHFGPKVVGASGAPQPQVKGEPPAGWARIEVPGARSKDGQELWAPRDFAETINNFYSAGLRTGQAKNSCRASTAR